MPTWAHLVVIPGLLVGFTVHELGHAMVAYWLGDTAQIQQGRLTFNPLRHVFWLGFLTFVFFGFGWARPMRMDARRFKSPYAGVFLVSIAGAVANVIWAGLVAMATLAMVSVVAAFTQQGVLGLLGDLSADVNTQSAIMAWGAAFTIQMVTVNLALAFFNLLPLPGLDGFAVIVSIIGWLRAQPETKAEAAVGAAEAPVHSEKALETPPEPLHTGEGRMPADIHFERGAAYQVAGQYEDAIARYRQAIKQDAHYGPAYVGMGQAYLSLDQASRAEHAFKGALQSAGDDRSRQLAWAGLQHLQAGEQEENVAAVTTEGLSPAVEPVVEELVNVSWIRFRLGGVLFLAANWGVYMVLAIGLIQHFS